jgi:helicase
LVNEGIPEEILKILKNKGYERLYPPQAEAIKEGLLDLENSFVVAVPTASGKTLIAELLMIKSLLVKGGKCLYIVPLRALASEKFDEFRKYEEAGIKVAISTGDYDSSDSWLARYDIIITTSEKADSLLRHRSEWLGSVKVLVADEIHLINDAGRGPTLEVTIAKLRHLNPDLLILGLSATIKNSEEIASWLNAKLIKSDWRPVRLRRGVYFNREILFEDSTIKEVESVAKEGVFNVALETVKNGGQSLVFINTRAGAERFALEAAKVCRNFIGKSEARVLRGLSEEVISVLAEPTRICRRLSRCIEGGTAFHHAGLAPEQRKIVEDAFKENLIKVLSATPTLAAGVNLPARRVIIRDYRRYEASLGQSEIPVLEIHQMCGRAGRPKYDDYGEAVMIARSFDERSYLLDNYILAEPESIYSKLAVEQALRVHTLATIATGFANSRYGVIDFFSKTFFAYQQEPYRLEELIQRALDFLLREGFIEEKREYILPTPFGRRTSELYIDPVSAVILRDALLKAEETDTNEVSYLHAIARTTELGRLYLRKKDYEACLNAIYEYEDNLLFEVPNQLIDPWGFENFLSEMKTALFLKDWIEEVSEDFIFKKYNLGPGDVRSKVELADWLLYSMAEIGRLFRASRTKEVVKLRMRVKHGVREELLPLVSLRGVGRARARRLFARGYKTLKDLREASIAELARVEMIGEKIAENIKKQLEGDKVEVERQSRLLEF